MTATKNDLLRWYRHAESIGAAAVAVYIDEGIPVPRFLNATALEANLLNDTHKVYTLPELLKLATAG